MNAWSREDIIIAYALYCVTPLGKINPSNKVIQQVAEIIPHSVASIVMRMRNFQYIDPKVSSGLKNVAKADRMIYEEFKRDWGSLSLEAETLTGLAIFDSSPLQGAKPLSSLTNHGRVSRERHFFKQAVLAAYDDRCFISGCGRNVISAEKRSSILFIDDTDLAFALVGESLALSHCAHLRRSSSEAPGFWNQKPPAE